MDIRLWKSGGADAMSAYIGDLQALLQAGDTDAFVRRWKSFHAAHYPNALPAGAFADVLALLRPQIDPGSWWRLVLRFCEARLDIATEPVAMFEYAGIVATLRQPLGLAPREILDASQQLRQLCNAPERWQFDHLLNDYYWGRRDKPTHLARQRGFLAKGEIDSLYCVTLEALPAPGDRAAEPSPKSGPWTFGPAARPGLWRACAWEQALDGEALTLTGPFGFDTNHRGGAGLFSLLASCDWHGVGGLEGAELLLNIRQDLARPARLLFGISAQECDPATGEPTIRSGYTLHEHALRNGENRIRLTAGDPAWRDMGDNPHSPPYRLYCPIPPDRMLARPMGLFLMLMQDDDPDIKEGRIILGDMRLTFPN